jgi:small conductance mechanosensitive channel
MPMNLNLDADWGRIATILVLGTVAWVVTRKLLSRLRVTLIAHADDDEEAKRITTLMRAIKQFVSMLLLAVVVMLVLSAIGINIAPLLGAAGVAGVAIGLAGQGIARDFIRGFSLLADNQIRVGDAVEVAGKSGVVEEVHLRHVMLRDYDGAVHFIPTGEIKIVTNRSYGHAFATLDVAVAENADVEQAMRAMHAVAEELRREPAFAKLILEPIDVAGVDGWAEGALRIKARLKVVAGSDATVRREMLRRLRERFERDGVALPCARPPLAMSAEAPAIVAGEGTAARV